MSIYLKIIRGGKEGKTGGNKLATRGKNVKIDVKLFPALGKLFHPITVGLSIVSSNDFDTVSVNQGH